MDGQSSRGRGVLDMCQSAAWSPSDLLAQKLAGAASLPAPLHSKWGPLSVLRPCPSAANRAHGAFGVQAGMRPTALRDTVVQGPLGPVIFRGFIATEAEDPPLESRCMPSSTSQYCVILGPSSPRGGSSYSHGTARSRLSPEQ